LENIMLVKFKTSGSNSAFGSFSPGDVLRCGDDLARHLVEDARVAEYVTQNASAAPAAAPAETPEAESAPEAASAPARRRARR